MVRSEIASSVALALLFATASCEKPVSRWVTGMVGHAGGSSNDRPRSIAPPDLRDCNHDLLDGRETDVSTSRAHCGACDAACDGACEAGECKALPSATAAAAPSPPPSARPTVSPAPSASGLPSSGTAPVSNEAPRAAH